MYKVTGSKPKGYKLSKLGTCGLWFTVSTHPSKQRANEAMKRTKALQAIQKSWGEFNNEEEKK